LVVVGHEIPLRLLTPDGTVSDVHDLPPSVVAKIAGVLPSVVATTQQSEVVGHDTPLNDEIPGQGFPPIRTHFPDDAEKLADAGASGSNRYAAPIRRLATIVN
jgi:hypothetical protein